MKTKVKIFAMLLVLVQMFSLIAGCKSNKVTISLDKTELTISVDEIAGLNAIASTGDTVLWRSSNDSIAIVSDDGKVKGITPGMATITAYVMVKDKEHTADCSVTVRNYYDYSAISNVVKGYVDDPVISIAIPDNGIENFNYTVEVKKDGIAVEDKIIDGTSFKTEEPGSYELTYYVSGDSISSTQFKRTVNISSVNPYYMIRSYITTEGLKATQADDVAMDSNVPDGAANGSQSVKLNNKTAEDYFRVVYMQENIVPLLADLGSTDTIGFRMFIETENPEDNVSIGVQSAIFRDHDLVDHKLTTPRVLANTWNYVGFSVQELKDTLGSRPEAFLGMYLQKSGDVKVKSAYIYSLEVSFGDLAMYTGESVKIALPSFDIENFAYTATLLTVDGTKVAEYDKTQKEITPDVGEYMLEYKVTGSNIIETTFYRDLSVKGIREYGELTKLKYPGAVQTNIPECEVTSQNIPEGSPAPEDAYYRVKATSASHNPRVVLTGVNIRDFIDELDDNGSIVIRMYQKLELKEGKTASNFRTWSDFDLFYGADLRINGAKQDLWVQGNAWIEMEIPVSFIRQHMGSYSTIYVGFYLAHSADFAITDIYLYDMLYRSPNQITALEGSTVDLALDNPGYGDLTYNLKVTDSEGAIITPDSENQMQYTMSNWGEYTVEYTNIQGYKMFTSRLVKTLQIAKTPAYGELSKFMYNNTAKSGIDENFSSLNPSEIVDIAQAPENGPAATGEKYYRTKRVEGYTPDNIRLVFTGVDFKKAIEGMNVDTGFVALSIYAKMEAKEGTTPSTYATNAQFRLFRDGNNGYGSNSVNLQLKGNEWTELQIPVSFISDQMNANSNEANAFLGLYTAPNGSGDVVITEVYLYGLSYHQGGLIQTGKSADLKLNTFNYANLKYDITVSDPDYETFSWTGSESNTIVNLPEYKTYQVVYSNITADGITSSSFSAEITASNINTTRSYEDQIDVSKTTELINWQGENTVERKVVELDGELRYVLFSKNVVNTSYYSVYLNPLIESELNQKRILPTDKFVIKFMVEGTAATYKVTPRVFFTKSSLSNANLDANTAKIVAPGTWNEIEISVQDMIDKAKDGATQKTPQYIGFLLDNAQGIYIASVKFVRGDIIAQANTSTSVGFPVGNRDKSNYTVIVKDSQGNVVFTGKEGGTNFIIAEGLPAGEYDVTYEAKANNITTLTTSCKLIVN